MDIKDWLTLAALIIGPVSAVCITLWVQRRAERRSPKERLFAVLMAHRRSNPPTIEWANALNLIDVAFQDNRAVVEKWHHAFALINNPVAQINWAQWGHAYLELLSEMAKDLGYRQLSQTDIDRFYAPVAHGTQAQLNQELQTEFLRVLKSTQSLHGTPLIEQQKPTQS